MTMAELLDSKVLSPLLNSHNSTSTRFPSVPVWSVLMSSLVQRMVPPPLVDVATQV